MNGSIRGRGSRAMAMVLLAGLALAGTATAVEPSVVGTPANAVLAQRREKSGGGLDGAINGGLRGALIGGVVVGGVVGAIGWAAKKGKKNGRDDDKPKPPQV